MAAVDRWFRDDANMPIARLHALCSGTSTGAGAADVDTAIDLYYEVHGLDSGARVLNIGGSGGDLRRTFPDRSPLNRDFRVLSYDQRCLGRSDRSAGDLTMADYADDAAQLIAAIGWDRCHVVGTSFGGMVALNLAVRHPHLIERLVLNCTSPGGTRPSYPLHELGARGSDPEETFATRMRLNDVRWDPAAAEPIPGLGRFYDVIAAQGRETPDDAVVAGLRRQLEARAGHDVEADVGRIRHETLVCAGRFDQIAPLANSEWLADQIPRARLEVFEGGHLFMLQDRRAFPAMIEFLHHGHAPNHLPTIIEHRDPEESP